MEYGTLAALGVALVTLLYLSGWFSRAETALTLTSAAEIASLAEDGVDVTHLRAVKKDLNRAIVAILIGNNTVNILLSTLSALVANALFRVWGVTVMVGLLTFAVIIFGEITPKSHAVAAHERVALKNARPVHLFMRALGPLITAFLFLSEHILRLFGEHVERDRLLFSDDDVKDLATLGEQEGAIKPIEKTIIHNVFSFGDRKIRDIVMPLDRVVRVGDGTDVHAAKQTVIEHGYTRIPVQDEHGDIVGVLYSKDLLDAAGGAVHEVMRPPFFIAGTADITAAFDEMKRLRVHMGIVKDEGGSVVGIVTLEDILEELVGNIRDEYYERHSKKEKVSRMLTFRRGKRPEP